VGHGAKALPRTHQPPSPELFVAGVDIDIADRKNAWDVVARMLYHHDAASSNWSKLCEQRSTLKPTF